MRPTKRTDLTPREFELAVQTLLEQEGVGLQEFSMKHLERIPGTDGDYIFDLTVRFSALGAQFVTLVECKNLQRRVERSDLLELQQKKLSVGAHKAMVVSAAGFQEGAHEFARVHGIALVTIADGSMVYGARAAAPVPSPQWVPAISFWLEQAAPEGSHRASAIGAVPSPEGATPSRRLLLDYLCTR